MLLTYLGDAEERGARVFADTLVQRVLGSGGRATGVRGLRRKRERFEIKAERVFLACGAVFSPFLLLKSGIRHLRSIGRHLTIHPSTRAYYLYEDRVDASVGAFQSFAIHQFRDQGIHLINLFP